MPKNLEITAVLTFITRPRDCGDFFIATFRTESGETFKAVGNAAEDDIKLWLSYRLYGQWQEKEKWGRQFSINTYILSKPHGRTGVIKYLQECPHLGEAMSVQLWNLFNSDAVRVCRECPELVAEKINRLDFKKCQEIAEALRELSAIEDTSIDLIDLFSGRGIPKRVAREAIKKFGNRAAGLFQHNPYLLMAFSGIGFDKADSMYCDLGHPQDKLKRQVFCLIHAIQKERDGHVWISEDKAKEYLAKKISGMKIDLDRALAVGVRAKKLAVRRQCETCKNTGAAEVPDLFFGDTVVKMTCPTCGGDELKQPRWIADFHKSQAEEYIAQHVVDSQDETPRWPSLSHPAFERLTPHQESRERLTHQPECQMGKVAGQNREASASSCLQQYSPRQCSASRESRIPHSREMERLPQDNPGRGGRCGSADT